MGSPIRPQLLFSKGALSAARSYEERKVQYMGRLYASLEFDASVSPGYANFLLGLLDRLTYRQLAALAYIGNERREQERVLFNANLVGTGVQSAPSIVIELGDLGMNGLIGFRQNTGGVAPPSNVFGDGKIDLNTIGQIGLTETGQTLYRLAELHEIPDDDQDEIAAALRGELG
jgi:hypothetical protein